MTKKKTLVITVAAAIVIAGILALIFLQLKPNEPPAPPIEPVNVSSEESSSEVSSEFVVPDIVPPEPIVTSKVESKTEDLTVKGNPDGTSSIPAVEAPPTSSNVTEKPKPKPTAKPTGDGDVYDERTDGYPKLGDTIPSRSGSTLIWVAEGSFNGGPGWVGAEVQSQPDVAADPGIPVDENGHIIYDPDYDIGAD